MAFKAEDAPRYAPGFIAVVVTSIAAALLILVYRGVCVWDNNKRDKAGTAEGFDNAFADDLTDLKVGSLLQLAAYLHEANEIYRTSSFAIPSNQSLCAWMAQARGGGIMLVALCCEDWGNRFVAI